MSGKKEVTKLVEKDKSNQRLKDQIGLPCLSIYPIFLIFHIYYFCHFNLLMLQLFDHFNTFPIEPLIFFVDIIRYV